jgi:hypothetical protein
MRKRIGDIFVEKGLINQSQLEQAVAYSQSNGIRLGDACVKLKFIKPEKLLSIFGTSNKINFFYLDVNHYPTITQNLFDIPTIIKFGVLPLGFKTQMKLFRTKRQLNIGLVSPDKQEKILPEIEKIAHAKLGEGSFQELKIYLILAEQLVGVLEKKYEFPEPKLRAFEGEMDERLILFLDSGSKLLSSKVLERVRR